MLYGLNFLDFCKKLSIGNFNYNPIELKARFELSASEFELLESKVRVFDGYLGGLILGRSHLEGGIHLLQYQSLTKKYTLAGEMEGWEFLSAPLTSQYYFNQFKNLNESVIPKEMREKTQFEFPNNCPVINTEYFQPSVLLISSRDHFIVNRFATEKHIETLIALNNEMNTE